MVGPKKIKLLNSESSAIEKTLYLFITGGAGAGKSYLVKILTKFLANTSNIYSGTPGKIFFLGATEVAALNINGTAIHAGLGINSNCNS